MVCASQDFFIRPFLTAFSILLLAAALACRRPETDPRPLGNRPLVVRLECKGGAPDAPLDACFGEALRDRLANQAIVVRQGSPEAMKAATLLVRLRIMEGRSEVVGHAAAQGFGAGFYAGWKATGKSGDGLKAAVGDAVAGVVVGTVFGVVAAPVNAVTAEARALYHNARLGYKPRHVLVQVALIPDPASKECDLFETSAFEVVKAMRPMKNSEAREEGRLAKEEAFALAKVVAERMERHFGWAQGLQPRPETPTQP